METIYIQNVFMCKFNFIMTESEFNRTREELLENISELFLKYGLRSTSMDDICSHLKISKKTLYQYFSNKDDLVEQIMMHRRNNYRTQKDIEDIFDLRIILESYAIRRSGQNLTSAYAEKLNAFMDTLIYYHKAADLQNYINADTGLHQLIIELSGNNLVISTYERVYSMVQQFRIYSLTSKERFDESVTEHTNIIQNILSGNAREADRINRTHLELAREKIIVYLNKKDALP